jgi:hypothetical protein
MAADLWPRAGVGCTLLQRPQSQHTGDTLGRNYNFSAIAALSADFRVSPHLAFRTTVQQMLIRYKSTVRDPAGIGIAPWLSFLSHDNYINSTNWGVSVGPVLRF